jgi:hypothetical protein
MRGMRGGADGYWGQDCQWYSFEDDEHVEEEGQLGVHEQEEHFDA